LLLFAVFLAEFRHAQGIGEQNRAILRHFAGKNRPPKDFGEAS